MTARYYLPQIVVGQGYDVYLDIVNMGEDQDSGNIRFFSQDGSQMFVIITPNVGTAFPFTLARGASAAYQVAHPTGLGIGYVIVESSALSSNLSVSLRYRSASDCQSQMFSVPASPAGKALTAPAAWDTDKNKKTALAMVNLTGGAAVATVELRNLDGSTYRKAVVQLGPNQHTALYLGEIFHRLTTFNGSATVRFTKATTDQSAVDGTMLALLQDGDLLASVAVKVLAPPVDQLLARCPTAAEVASINADLDLSFETDPTAGTFRCTPEIGSVNLTEMQRRVYQTLLVMRELQFSEPLPWTSKQLYTWFTDVISGIRFRSDIEYSFCCDPQGTINVRQSPNSYLALTTRWVEPELGGGLIDLLVHFAHEARHYEGKPHTCGSNDNTIAEMGAWGVQYYLDLWLAEKVDTAFISDSDYLAMAKQHADQIKNTSFCSN